MTLTLALTRTLTLTLTLTLTPTLTQPNPDPNPDTNPNPNPNQADLFVLTSLYENFCMAAHEATFFGLPLLAYDVGEIASFRAHLGSVLLPVGDEAGFSAELARLLREP